MTGIFRSATSDLSTTLTWAVMTSVITWACSIKSMGLGKWLKGYINPMNIISEIAQPVSMAFRHFGNIMGGGVLMSLLYTALAAGSAAIIGLIRKSGIAVAIIVIAMGVALFILGRKKKKFILKVLGIAFVLIGISSLIEIAGLLSGIPILELGIPGVLSLYFDIFSGGVQALVFSLLTMVYVGTACPPKDEKKTQE
jgi:F-type H+-transporting ATPase subunit a